MRWWLPEDHLAWKIIRISGELDLSGLAGAYRSDGQGQAPYDPVMMMTLIFYCTAKGTRSARKMAAACTDDVGCRVILAGSPRPSHQAFATFRRRHRDAIRAQFVQVLALLAADGAFDGRVVAVDGSPVPGSASRFGNLTGEQLGKRIDSVRDRLGAAVGEWLDGTPGQGTLDEDDEDDEDGPGLPGGMPRRVSSLARQLERLREARRRLEEKTAAPGGAAEAAAAARRRAEEAQAGLEEAEAAQDALMERYEQTAAAGKPWPRGKVPVPKERSARLARRRDRVRRHWERARAAARAAVLAAEKLKVNPADPASLTLPAKNGGGWVQGFNLEIGAARGQILTAAEIHDSPVDAGALVPVITASAANLAAAARRPGAAGLAGRVRAWLADSGYASAANFAELGDLLLLVAVSKESAQTGRGTDGRAEGRTTPKAWEPMKARLATDAGKRLYRRRAAYVEPAFAQLFARFGRFFLYRGRDAVDAEAKLLGTVHNILKLTAFRDRARPGWARGPAAAPA